MLPSDYEAALDLWQRTPGLGLSEADSAANIDQFLSRNKGLSFVAAAGQELIGTCLCGHDGRRGFLYHLTVHPRYRRQGIGRALAERCLAQLKAAGIAKCHLFVLADNRQGMDFWDRIGFQERADICIYSCNIGL
ncbi:GNAT family N-acetyltransferase [Sporomusa termitida]|uniref:GNAT family N-acetyltransferase n=1 Tax=Sporomusa termitida TaxID=2377 RepID=UPI0011865E29|nr:GNAT family N-acetyltransferase [Sporomusa termitida]